MAADVPPDGAHARPGTSSLLSPRGLALSALAFGVLVAFQAGSFFPMWTDENIHSYVAARVSQGAVLYADIDSARPPLAIFAPALLMRLGLAPLLALRASVLVAQMLSAATLTALGHRLFGARVALLSVLLFVLAPESAYRVVYTGIHLVALLSLLCLAAALLHKPLASGLLAGLALGAGQHSLVLAFCAFLWLALHRPRSGLTFVAGLVASLSSVLGLAYVLGARHLFHNLVGIHLFHLGGLDPEASAATIRALLAEWSLAHAPMLALLGLASLYSARALRARAPHDPTERAASRALALLLGVIVAHVLVVLAMTGPQFMYLLVIYPELCLVSAVGLECVLRWTLESRAQRALRGASVCLTLTLVTLVSWGALCARRSRADDESYSLLPHVQALQMARVQRLSVASVIARDLERDLSPGDTIFGDSTLVDQVAVESGLRVSAELADLMTRWFAQGTVSPDDVLARIESDRVSAFLTPRWGFLAEPRFRAYLMRCFERPVVYPPMVGDGRGIPEMLVFRRKPVERPCLP